MIARLLADMTRSLTVAEDRLTVSDVEFESDDLEYLLTKLGQMSLAREHVH